MQGVGFRPYAFRLASELGLDGWVLNDERGVLLEVEGDRVGVDAFLSRLPAEAPPLAAVERVRSEEIDPDGAGRGFEIVQSERGGEAAAAVSPDSASCDQCLAEVFDPADRRHRYPFTNCTNCGPRFTIVRGVPYDRPLTTMAGFEMCEACRAEYEDPLDRRFHAQPNACPDCGPRAWVAGPDGAEIPPGELAAPGGDAIAAAAAQLAAGRIVAVKGIGGFHLACLAADEGAVAALRSRKHREQKPFALMAPSLKAAGSLIVAGEAERRLLGGRERPIVIGRRRDLEGDQGGVRVAPSVAPASADLGVMLPYSPLHHLLLSDLERAAGPGASLVMTSGNLSEEPIAYEDEDAVARLAAIADLFLLHDRPIQTRTDDSVVRAVGDAGRSAPGPLLMRRSRGYVPDAVPLPVAAPAPVLACGAELKNTFCLAKGGRAWVGHHIGDLENYETLTSFAAGIEHFQRLFAIEPEIVAHDLHPEYLSTKHALELDGVRRLGVQHHHAHMAACLGEHGEVGEAVGAIYDGTGYGPDETVWGGELLVGGIGSFERAGMLWPVRLPGGSAAIREPWRMACAWLSAAEGAQEPGLPRALETEVERGAWLDVCELVRTGVASPPTTSMGRLFDAVAAICGIGARVDYEGQAAAELEAVADLGERGAYPLPVVDEGVVLLDARELVRLARDDAAAGRQPGLISARFHNAVAEATAAACAAEAGRRGLEIVVLSGGVFQNRLLLERAGQRLAALGLRVLAPRLLPPNDGGISYGQATIAAASVADSR